MSDDFSVLQSPARCTLQIQVEESDEEEALDEALLLDVVRRASRLNGARDHSHPMYVHVGDVQTAAISYRGTGKHGNPWDRSWVVTDGRHFALIEHMASEKGSLPREALDAVVKTARFTAAVE